MRPKVYVETSIVSYLTARLSQNLVVAARQALTREWWEVQRSLYDCFLSEFVLNEASAGDPKAAEKRLAALADLPRIDLSPEAEALAHGLVEDKILPAAAAVDALHLGAAVSGSAEYLLTWNFKHLANATLRSAIEDACEARGFQPCIICTPEELVEGVS